MTDDAPDGADDGKDDGAASSHVGPSADPEPVPGGLPDGSPAAFVAPDVARVGLGVGSPEGENSAYVLPKLGVVVDPGPPTDAAWSRLVDGIRATGLAVDDVALVLLTHWHADHAGLGPRLAERANATLAMHEADAALVADYAEERERRLDRDAVRLRAWGVPDERVRALRDRDRPSPMPDEYPVRELSEGERVLGLKVVHVPGHTLGGAAYLLDDGTRSASDGSRRDGPLLFVGDHALPTYTPNVGGGDSRLFGTDPGRDPAGTDLDHPDPLMVYLDALDRLARIVGADRSSGETARSGGETARPSSGVDRSDSEVDRSGSEVDRSDSEVDRSGSEEDRSSDGANGSSSGANRPDDGAERASGGVEGGERAAADGEPPDAGADGAAGAERNGVGTLDAVYRGLPGHGKPFDLGARADEITEHHRTRQRRVAEAVANADVGSDPGVTPWSVARELFGEMDGVHAKMGVGEAAAHLAALRAIGEIEIVGEEPLQYSPVE